MAKISIIGDALKRINDAAFQELCNKFLKYKYDYKNIIQTGSVIGKEKTRKGTPDTIFIDRKDSYVFVESTTKERKGNSKSFYEKVESDVYKCFDTQRTKIGNDRISKIIICHTQRLKLIEFEKLTKICKSFNENCIFEQYGIDDLSIELESYSSLLKAYLDINNDTGQLMQLPEYINYYEKPDLRLATPLGNEFIGRKEKIIEGILLIAECNLLLITGASGVGKTKYAIELCKQYIEENNTFYILCFAENGMNAYDDLQTHLLSDRDYIILVDDANRANVNYNFILYLLRKERKGRIKIIVTVRDYALDLVEKSSSEYNFRKVTLDVLPPEEISEILKSDSFKINESFIDKIKSISHGNLRVAIISAVVINKEKSLSTLNNISQLYELYFREINQKISKNDENITLKVLGIISFFRVISKERTKINEKIFTVFDIDESTFWLQSRELNKSEIVDLYENEVVKISDQILSTYYFHKIYFEKKILDFKLLIDNFIEFESNFYDALNPIFDAYDRKYITDELTWIIENNWNVLTYNNDFHRILEIVSVFWFCIGNKTLSYFYDYISKLPESNNKDFVADYEHNEMVTNTDKDILSILSNFRHFGDEKTRMALDIMFLYVEKNPDQSKRLAYLLNEKWMIIRYDINIEFSIQHLLVNFLIEKIETRSSQIYHVFFCSIASKLLETRFLEHKSNGHRFTTYTIYIQLSESIKLLRKNIWDTAWFLYDKEPEAFYKLVLNLKYERYDGANKLWKYDCSIVIPLLLKIDYESFIACEATKCYLKIMDWAKVKYDKSIKEIAINRLFSLNKLLIDKEFCHDTKDFDIKKRKRLSTYCSNFKFDDYVNLFKDVETIKTLSSKGHDYSAPLTYIIEDIIPKNHELFIKVLDYVLINHSFRLWSIRILNIYFNTIANYTELYICLKNSTYINRKYWLLEFHGTIPEKYLNNVNRYLLHDFYELLSVLDIKSCRINYIIDKYCVYEPKQIICDKILNILIDNTQLVIDEEFLDLALDTTNDYSRCKTLYLNYKSHNKSYDHEDLILLKFLKEDSEFIIRYLEIVHKGHNSIHDYSSEKFNLIWGLSNYQEVIMSAVDYFITKKYRTFSSDSVVVLFINLGEYNEKALLFIENLINEKYENVQYIEIAFNIIAQIFVGQKKQFVKQFLKLNQDFEFFKKIDLFPSYMSAVGSWIPYYQRRIEEWQTILDSVNSLNMGIKLIDHIIYIEQRIKYLNEDIKSESKREFIERYSY